MKLSLYPEPSALSADQMRRGQNQIIACCVISILFWVGLNDRVISLFILGLNPQVSDATLAFFFSLGPLTAVLTALMSPLVEFRGKKRILVPFYTAGAVFLVLLTVLPSVGTRWLPDTRVLTVAALLTGYYCLRSLGFAGWFPLINDNVPDESRGRFFGRMRTSWQIVLIVCSAAAGWFLGHRPEPWQFQVLFAIAVGANLAMTVGILGIPEAPLGAANRALSFWRMLAVPFRDRSFVAFLLFGMLFNLAAALAGPFALRCMKQTLHAGDNFVVWMDTLSSIGAAATLPLWGRFVDRFGGRVVFALLLPPLALLNLVWLVVTPDLATWRAWLAAFFVIQGILLFGIGVGVTDMMLGSAREGHRSAYINIAFVASTLAAGVGPFLGTLVARSFADVGGHWGPVTLDANRWVFLFRFGLTLAPLFLVKRLSREHGGHVGEALQRLSAGLLSLVPSIRR